MTAARAGLSIATAVVELTRPPPALDFTEAEEWRILLTLDDVPQMMLRLPSPGATTGDGILTAAVRAHGEWLLVRRRAVERLRRRLGVAERRFERPTCTVIVCTHRRPDYVTDLLGALGRLEPAPDEIIVVDNDPGEADCLGEVEAAGARYLREDRRGLDRARTTGLRAARGELVAFTDDDCLPAPTWLRALPELFDDEAVAAVTGPAFAHSLDTPAQVRFEGTGGFGRGWRRRTLDLAVHSPLAAGAAGAGANMIFRREVLEAIGEPFPPELDAGTPTQSGGDMYALFKVLASGRRVVYDPGSYVFHQHRPDARGLHDAIWGYGVGMSAVLTKLLVEEREFATPGTWLWLWRQYAQVMRRRLTRRADSVDVRLGWDYLRGGFAGAGAWRRSRQAFCERDGQLRVRESARPAAPLPASTPATPAGTPELSVVVPTAGRADALRRCLEALAQQRQGATGVEVIVVDDAPGEARLGPWPEGLAVRTVRSGGGGAAAARNAGVDAARGRVLLFLDDDLVPRPGLLARHLEHHRGGAGERIVIGYSAPRPPRPGLAALTAALWWEDHFRAKRDAAAVTFVDMLSGNMSVPRATFERLGPFDASFGRLRREDWEWGIRARRDGVEVVYDAAAVAEHEFRISVRGRLDTVFLEGGGDALLLERLPGALPSLPQRRTRPLAGGPLWMLARPLVGSATGRLTAAAALDALEQVRARVAWRRLFARAQSAAYEHGFHSAPRSHARPRGEVHVLPVEVTAEESIAPPSVAAPVVEVRLAGRPMGRLDPEEGHWPASLAERIGEAVPQPYWERLAAASSLTQSEPDLAGVNVLFGPARRPGDFRHRQALAAAGAVVNVLDGPAGRHWTLLDRAIRDSTAGLVVMPMPAVAPGPQSVGDASVAFDGERVAAAVGLVLRPEEPAGPLTLLSRATSPRPYALSPAPEYLIVRPRVYETLGGFDPAASRLGFQAPVLDLVERALEGGYLVGSRNVPGIDLSGSWDRFRRRADLRREQARAGLLWRRAAALGPAAGARRFAVEGALPSGLGLVRGVRRRSPKHAAGLTFAFTVGSVRAALLGPCER